jgi:hypothetical protein
MAAAAVSSAAPLLALLEEEDDKLKVHALKQLDSVVPQFWYQISNYIPQVEALCEDTDFSYREAASLLVSKVSCHRAGLALTSSLRRDRPRGAVWLAIAYAHIYCILCCVCGRSWADAPAWLTTCPLTGKPVLKYPSTAGVLLSARARRGAQLRARGGQPLQHRRRL